MRTAALAVTLAIIAALGIRAYDRNQQAAREQAAAQLKATQELTAAVRQQQATAQAQATAPTTAPTPAAATDPQADRQAADVAAQWKQVTDADAVNHDARTQTAAQAAEADAAVAEADRQEAPYSVAIPPATEEPAAQIDRNAALKAAVKAALVKKAAALIFGGI